MARRTTNELWEENHTQDRTPEWWAARRSRLDEEMEVRQLEVGPKWKHEKHERDRVEQLTVFGNDTRI